MVTHAYVCCELERYVIHVYYGPLKFIVHMDHLLFFTW